MNVLVIGDSFGCIKENDTWLGKLSSKYNWKIVNYSVAGSGPLYLIHKFLFLHENQEVKNFDLVIFLWSEPFRQFAPGDPRLSLDIDPEKSVNTKNFKIDQLIENIRRYFWNDRYFNIEHISNCVWMDYFIKNNYPNIKFWHLQCFPYYETGKEHFVHAADLKNQKHYHYFEHGINISPSLAYLSMQDNFKSKKQIMKKFRHDNRPGHLSNEMHILLFENLSKLFELEHKDGTEFFFHPELDQIQLGPYAIDKRDK